MANTSLHFKTNYAVSSKRLSRFTKEGKCSLVQFHRFCQRLQLSSSLDWGRLWDLRSSCGGVVLLPRIKISQIGEEQRLAFHLASSKCEANLTRCVTQTLASTSPLFLFLGKATVPHRGGRNSCQLKVFELLTNSCQDPLRSHRSVTSRAASVHVALHFETRRNTVTLTGCVQEGSLFASCTKDRSVRVWQMDSDSGQVSCVAQGCSHASAVSSITCSRMKASFIVSGSQDCAQRGCKQRCGVLNDKLLASNSQDGPCWRPLCKRHRQALDLQDFSHLQDFLRDDAASVLKEVILSRALSCSPASVRGGQASCWRKRYRNTCGSERVTPALLCGGDTSQKPHRMPRQSSRCSWHLQPRELLQYQAPRLLGGLIPCHRVQHRADTCRGLVLQASMFLNYMWQKMRWQGTIRVKSRRVSRCRLELMNYLIWAKDEEMEHHSSCQTVLHMIDNKEKKKGQRRESEARDDSDGGQMKINCLLKRRRTMSQRHRKASTTGRG
ncbi:transducin beta-like protein 3 [Lates japonicus]|uniref:Transducin beta-like protein 3 n=1 Tax=Lates japonicus TaxID=270547 RepID=A0AAD3N5G4_LATJO|nr:transducin beta-like protein 3 [Lates japonicus]